MSLKLSKLRLDLAEYKASDMVIGVPLDNANWVLPKPSIRVDGPEIVVTEVTLGVKLMKYF